MKHRYQNCVQPPYLFRANKTHYLLMEKKLELSSRTRSGRAPRNRGKFVVPAGVKQINIFHFISFVVSEKQNSLFHLGSVIKCLLFQKRA